jgi:hypothetical protein
VESPVVPSALGHDVDHPEHGLAAVHHGTWPERDLDVIDELEGHACAALEIGCAVPGLVDGYTVDQEQYVIAVVAA